MFAHHISIAAKLFAALIVAVVPMAIHVEHLERQPWLQENLQLRDEARSFCTVHHLRFLRQKVPVLYGLFGEPEDGYREGELHLFPNAHDVYFGGCIVGRIGSMREVEYCPECRKAKLKWVKMHPARQDRR